MIFPAIANKCFVVMKENAYRFSSAIAALENCFCIEIEIFSILKKVTIYGEYFLLGVSTTS